MSAQPKLASVSEAEYYAMAEASDTKLEFIRGQIVAMAGGSPNHAIISANLIGTLHSLLKGKPCYVATSDQRVRSQATGDDTYPDVVVVCPPAQYDPRNGHTLLNPTVLIEVLSPSTTQFDLIDKNDIYFTIPSLKSYIIVSQDRIRVEHRIRSHASFEPYIYSRREEEVRLPELGISLSIDEIYDRLALPSLSVVLLDGS